MYVQAEGEFQSEASPAKSQALNGLCKILRRWPSARPAAVARGRRVNKTIEESSGRDYERCSESGDIL